MAVVLRSLSSFLILVCLSLSASAQAPKITLAEQHSERYVANILLHSSTELNELLTRAENLFQKDRSYQDAPLVLVLHGPEARIFQRENYASNRALVDKAARLSAFGIIDIRVCETWMGAKELDINTLLPFVGTVPQGVAYEKELLEQQNFVYF